MTINLYDLEVLGNLFVGVFKEPKNKEYFVFIIWNDGVKTIDDRNSMRSYLKDKLLVGFNNLSFDAPVLDYVLSDDRPDVYQIKRYANECIDAKWPLKREEQLKIPNLDLLKIHHYDNNARRTSLKQLEFFFQLANIKELPFAHDAIIKTEAQVKKIVSYCKYDLKPTEIFFEKSREHILHRQDVTRMFNMSAMNMSDSSIGENMVLSVLSKELQIPREKLDKMRTQYDEIEIKDLIFSYIWSSPWVLDAKENYFNHLHLKSTVSDKGNKVFDIKSQQDFTQIHFNNGLQLTITYGLGGIHGCVPKGVYESDQDYIIMSCDVAGEYPNVIAANQLYIQHFGPQFTQIYKEHIVDERKKWPKSTHKRLNKSYKDAGNCVFGKTGSEYSALYDPKVMLTITVNGQLMKALLGNLLSLIPDSKLLMLNTDGLEIRIPRKYKHWYHLICARWEKLTNLDLEHDEYEKLVINNVNNYIGFYTNGKVKRKGLFCLREDLIANEQYHKNPSSCIIQEAIFNYFKDGTPVETTIKNCQSLHDFAIGVKKQKGFDFGLLIADHNRSVSIKKNSDRLLRFYVAKHQGLPDEKYETGSLVKFWHDSRITSILKDHTVNIIQRIVGKDLSRYKNIDYDYYIYEAYKIISDIEGMELA